MQKVLIIDEHEYLHRMWNFQLKNKARLIHATSINEAEKIVARIKDIAVIVVAACVGDIRPTTQGLVKKIRETFKGPMVGISIMEDNRNELLQAGCNYACEKIDVAKVVTGILQPTS